jgi:hypothetical protein
MVHKGFTAFDKINRAAPGILGASEEPGWRGSGSINVRHRLPGSECFFFLFCSYSYYVSPRLITHRLIVGGRTFRVVHFATYRRRHKGAQGI